MMKKNRSTSEIENICQLLLSGRMGNDPLVVKLSEFQLFYSTIVNLKKISPLIDIINLEDRVIAQFSEISPQHFIIMEPGLQKSNFNFASNITWYGIEKHTDKFPIFIGKEIYQKWFYVLSIFSISAILLYSIHSLSYYGQLISILIQSATVFMSIYIIFSVSQSKMLSTDKTLFISGILQKYYNDDKNVTILAIVTIAELIISSGINELLTKILSSNIKLENIIYIIDIIIISTGITLLFMTFETVANYYIDRSRDIIERDMISEILHNEYKKYNK
jgi:hypothetical protein